jgi:hypothetical protein
LLGVGSYFAKFITLLRLPMDMVVFLTTTHLIVGALMLVTSLALTIHSYRLSERTKPAGGKMRLTRELLSPYRGC